MRLSSYIISLLLFVAFIVLAVNVYATQVVDPLFVQISTNHSKTAAKKLLTKLSASGYFNTQLSYFISMFGPDFQTELMQTQHERQKRIIEYKKILKINPKSTNLLLGLSILYFENGNFDQARAYYRQAKKVDPWINVQELEELIK